MIKKDFVKESLIYAVSSSLSTVASFLLLPFYTSTKLLSVSDFGALSLYIGLSVLVQMFASFSLEFYVVVSYHEVKDNPTLLKSKIASLNGYLIAISTAIILSFALGGNFFIQHFIANARPETFRYIMMSVFTGVFNAHFKFYNNLLPNIPKPWRLFGSNVLNLVTTVIFSVIILKVYPQTLEGPIWGRFLSCLCIFIFSFTDMTRNYGIAFKKEFLLPMLQFCGPLTITAFFQWILTYSDRYIIKSFLFNKEVAIYDLAVKCSLLLNFLLDGLTNAMAPRIFDLFRNIDKPENISQINKYYSGFNILTILLVSVNILILPIVLPIFISDEKYLRAFLYFGIIGVGFITRGAQNLFMYPLHAFKKTSRFIVINGIAAGVQLICSYFMVSKFKLYGAAFTLNIVKVFLIVLFMYFCRDLISDKINIRKMFILPLAVVILVSLMELLIQSYGLKMHIIHFAEFCIISCFTFLVYKTELVELYKWGMEFIRSKLLKPE